MEIIETVHAMRSWRSEQDRGVGLVPTMGALHAGHEALVARAKTDGRAVVLSIFVNPLQFAPGEDFTRYPRPLADDLEVARAAGTDVVFRPSAEEMYPEGDTTTRIELGRITQILCGRSRPTHFTGVATVVAKLFNIVRPVRAYFGLKDAQQVAVIRRLVRDLSYPVEVVGVPTVREPSGLALSSRNRYLSPAERGQASALSSGLFDAADAFRAGERRRAVLVELVRTRLVQAGLEPEYVEAVAWDSLEPLGADIGEGPVLLATAVRVGAARLIDNVILASGDAASPDAYSAP